MASEPKQAGGIGGLELAELLGVTERTITDLAKRGIIVRLGRGRYALKASIQQYCAHIREQAAGRYGTEGGLNPVEESAQLRREQRLLAEMRRKHLDGELISIPEVEEAWTEIAAKTQALFLALPSRARFDLPHLTGADQKVLERLARDMLTETAFGQSQPVVPGQGKAPSPARAKHDS